MSRLSDELLDEVVARHPVPIADAVVALVHAEGPHERRDRVVEVFRATLRYVAAVALSARLAASDQGVTSPEAMLRLRTKGEDKARELLRSLRQRALTDGQWLHLAREVTRPYADAPATHPLPVLIELLHGSRAVLGDAERLLGMRTSETVAHGTTGDPIEVEKILQEREPQLARLLSSLGPLHASTRLVVPLAAPAAAGEPQHAWQLMGATPPRGRWRRVPLASRLEPGGCVLVDAEGRLLVPLDPAVRFGPPSPGAVEELFFLDGRGPRRSARYIALPSSAELHVRDVWRRIDQEIAGEERAAADAGAKPAHPYPGLTPFGIGDAEIFFGREEEVQSLANRVRAHPMLTVTGPSGSGKSSLLRAGVAAALTREHPGYRERGERTVILFVRPGTAPMRELAAMIERELPEVIDPDDDRELSAIAPKVLAARIRDLAAERGVLLVLCVDQAEELLTLAGDRAEAEGCAELLAALGSAESGPTRVILAVREDFFARLSELRALRGLYDREVAVLGAPDRDALLRALVEPARRFDASYEAGLAERMVDAVGGAAGALPLLQFAARALWDRADGRTTLTAADYEAIGGVDGALGRHADATLDALPPSRQSAARPILLRLLTPAGTRATVRREALLAAADQEDAAAVLDALESSRLITARQDAGGDAVCELAHESLAVHWPRFARWRAEDTEGASHLAALSQAASAWISRGRRPELLWRGDLLAEHRAWQSRTGQRLTGDEQAFIAGSEAAARAARTRRIALVAGVIAALGGFGIFAGIQWQKADLSLAVAEERGHAARVEQELATWQSLLLRAREYAAAGQTPQEIAVLRVLARPESDEDAGLALPELHFDFPGHPVTAEPVPASEIVAQRRRMAILAGGFLWKAQGRLARGIGHDVGGSLRSADGSRFMALDGDRIRVWDAGTGALLREVEIQGTPILEISILGMTEQQAITSQIFQSIRGAFMHGLSPSGRRLLVIDCASPNVPECSGFGSQGNLRLFDPDAGIALRTRLIDVDSGEELFRQIGGELAAGSLAFAPDDSGWARVGSDTIEVHRGGETAVPLPEGCGAPIALAADGRIALSCADSVRLVAGEAPPASLPRDALPIDALAFVGDGRWLVATGMHPAVWDLERGVRHGTGRFAQGVRTRSSTRMEHARRQSHFTWENAFGLVPDGVVVSHSDLSPPEFRALFPLVALEQSATTLIVPDARSVRPLGLLRLSTAAVEQDVGASDGTFVLPAGAPMGALELALPADVSYPDPVSGPCVAAAGQSHYAVRLLDAGRRVLLDDQELRLDVPYGDQLLEPPAPHDAPLRYHRPAAPLDAPGCLLWETTVRAPREEAFDAGAQIVWLSAAGDRVAWQTAGGSFLRTGRGAAPVPLTGTAPALSPSGRRVATFGDGEVHLFDAGSGRALRTVRVAEPGAWVWQRPHPERRWVGDRLLVTAGRVIEVEGDAEPAQLPEETAMIAGSALVVETTADAYVMRRGTEVVVRHPRLLAPGPDGTPRSYDLPRAVTEDGVALVWGDAGATLLRREGAVPVEGPSAPRYAVFDVRGSEIRMFEPDARVVWRWDARSGQVARTALATRSLFLPDAAEATETRFLGPDRLLVRFAIPQRQATSATGSQNGLSVVFDLADGAPIWAGDSEGAAGEWIASEGVIFRPVVLIDALLADTGRRTNFRVCRGDYRAVPVDPPPPADSVWAPESACTR